MTSPVQINTSANISLSIFIFACRQLWHHVFMHWVVDRVESAVLSGRGWSIVSRMAQVLFPLWMYHDIDWRVEDQSFFNVDQVDPIARERGKGEGENRFWKTGLDGSYRAYKLTTLCLRVRC